MTKPSKGKAIERLTKILLDSLFLREKSDESPEFAKWIRGAHAAIAYAFGERSRQLSDFNGVDYTTPIGYGDEDGIFHHTDNPYFKGLDLAEAILESMIDEIVEYWEDDNVPIPDSATTDRRQPAVTSRRVFVVHGRDEGAKESVARFLQKVGLEPVILSELPAKGQTIIEKFKSNSDVGFSVALLTPDDAGALDGEAELIPRARQNVVFELGFFIGKLGRERVCALTKGEPEIPSDYAGVEYIPLDDHGAWQMKLFRELRAAGFDIDADRLIGV